MDVPLFALSVCHYHRYGVRLAFFMSFSFAKVQRPAAMPSTATTISGKIMAAAFRDLCQIGYSAIILPEIPWRRPPIGLFTIPQRKGTKSETKSMTTDKEKTQG